MAKRICPHCRKKIHHKATTCPYCRNEITPISFWKTNAGILLIAIGIMAVIIILVPKPTPQKSVQQVGPEPEPTETQQDQINKTQEKGLTVTDFNWESGEFGNKYLVGTLKNNSDKQYSYVQIEFNLYDKSGAQVGSTLANVNNLEPYGTWKFKAYVIEDTATMAKIKDITGF